MSDRLVYLQADLPGIPEDLMIARDRGEVLFLTGAGVSTPAPSSLPGFAGLVVDIYKKLDSRLAQAMSTYRAAPKDKGPPDYRDAGSGKFVTPGFAKNHPKTTEKEHNRPPPKK